MSGSEPQNSHTHGQDRAVPQLVSSAAMAHRAANTSEMLKSGPPLFNNVSVDLGTSETRDADVQGENLFPISLFWEAGPPLLVSRESATIEE